MKVKILSLCLLALLFSVNSLGANNNSQEWWNTSYPKQFDVNQLTNKQGFISVKGNKLVDESGQPFLFKGLNIADPTKLIRDGQWSKKLFTELNDWGVNVIRLPIHPAAWRGFGQEKYLALLDQAVIWANSLNIYLIIDWHSIGYLPAELYQHPMYDTTVKETRTFWKDIAFRYTAIPTIAVYELFNEPTDMSGRAGNANWLQWKSLNEELIDIIYAHDKNVIPLVAGFNWAYDLRPLAHAPINREGIAYAVHPYPQKAKPEVKSKENFFRLWEQVWGFAARKYPLIATELGWVKADGKGAHIPVINDGTYGPHIIEFMHDRNVSWVAWVFDPNWSPTMISDWNFTPTQQGEFFKQELLKNRE